MRSRPRFLVNVSSGSGRSSSSSQPEVLVLRRSEKLCSMLREILLLGDPVSGSSPGSTYACHLRMSTERSMQIVLNNISSVKQQLHIPNQYQRVRLSYFRFAVASFLPLIKLACQCDRVVRSPNFAADP